MSISSGEEPHSHRYFSVPKSVQLIPKIFNGNPLELREFIQNLESSYEVVDPLDYSLLLKFVQAKIGGEAKTKLLARTHLHTWEQVRAVLEENYRVRKTLDYYAHRAFSSKQNPVEKISQWGARMDTVCGDDNNVPHVSKWKTWNGIMRSAREVAYNRFELSRLFYTRLA
jgi:hypothetical protein